MYDIYEYVCNIYQCKKVRSIVEGPDILNNIKHIVDMLIFSYILCVYDPHILNNELLYLFFLFKT